MTKKSTKKKSPVKKKSTGIVIHKPKILSLANPEDVDSFGKTLKKFIVDNKLSLKIRGEDYCLVDGWKFAGFAFNITAVPSKPEPRHLKGEYVTTLFAMRQYYDSKGKPTYKKESPVFVGYSDNEKILNSERKKNNITREMTRPHFSYECDCTVQNILTGAFVNRGSGQCSNIEIKKSDFSEHQVKSMTETRSISKGFRNLLGHVMKASGMQSTPAEEMEFPDDEQYTSYEETETNQLPELTDEIYEKALDKIRSGEWNVDYLKKGYTLNEEQEKSLRTVQDKYKK